MTVLKAVIGAVLAGLVVYLLVDGIRGELRSRQFDRDLKACIAWASDPANGIVPATDPEAWCRAE